MSYIIKLYNSLNDIRFMNDFIYCVCTNDPINNVIFQNDNKLVSVDNISYYEYTRNKVIFLNLYVEKFKLVFLGKNYINKLKIYYDTSISYIRNITLHELNSGIDHKETTEIYCIFIQENTKSYFIQCPNEFYGNYYVTRFKLPYIRVANNKCYIFKPLNYLSTNDIHIYDKFSIALIHQKDFMVYKYDSTCYLNFVQYSKVDMLYVIDVSLIFSNPIQCLLDFIILIRE